LDVVLDSAGLLMVYDSQLRDEAEVSSALTWQRHGPLIWATYPRRARIRHLPGAAR